MATYVGEVVAGGTKVDGDVEFVVLRVLIRAPLAHEAARRGGGAVHEEAREEHDGQEANASDTEEAHGSSHSLM